MAAAILDGLPMRTTSTALALVLCACSSEPGGDGSATQATATMTSTDGTTGADTSASGTVATTQGSSGASVGDTSTSTGGDETSTPIFDVGGSGPPPDLGEPEGPAIPETCDQALAGESTVGCRFFAVDLDQNGGLEFDQYAIAVSNPQPATDADVVVEQKVGGAWQEVASMTVQPLTLHPFQLPNKHQQGSGVQVGGAYRVTSNIPIVAYQFNPLIIGSASSDASMLYPVPSWDSLNRAVHWGGGYGRGYLTIAAAFDGTTIEVTPTNATAAGTGVPAGMAGVPFEVELDEGDIAEVMVVAEAASLAGTRIESDDPDKPVAVFSGHECAWVPHTVPACDHIEDQLAGVRLWGTHFVAARMPVREVGAPPETSLWQIVASEDGTTVSFDAHAEVTGLPDAPVMLDAGEYVEYYVGGTDENPGDFRVEADKPIAVANLMTGEANLTSSTLGDPALVQLSPIEQYLPRYIVLIATGWQVDAFVVTRPAGVEVTLDGVAIPDDAFISVGGDYEVARVPGNDGVHSLDSTEGFMVTVVGYDSADSYAYLGGTGTGVINPTPEG